MAKVLKEEKKAVQKVSKEAASTNTKKSKKVTTPETEEKTSKKTSAIPSKKKSVASKKASTSTKAELVKEENKRESSTSKTNRTKKGVSTKSSTSKARSTTSKKGTSTRAKKSSSRIKKTNHSVEYYDLPYRYNETIIKLLAQTPKRLFVYWDISDFDRDMLKKEYGERFFEDTRPVLIVHNLDRDYSFEIPINDFANSWYLDVGDTKCKYYIELGRRFITFQEPSSPVSSNYVYITSSNTIEAPNNHILFEKSQNMVYFRNVKTQQVTSKNIATLSFIRNIGKVYHFYDMYKKMYPNENLEEFNNPSSSQF